ncbi:FAST kinase domain-containing protein 4 isoform X1 [Nasonia vitripennis]|uniref:RAP domain-containing protein n=2 Tax=Nasonia vitripennis TaxID=7425 RepID=A0A7M7H903_NASVI|nr:FAST kinase domain-containing protein 4 isoform X1 [Nasonia vitripennis]
MSDIRVLMAMLQLGGTLSNSTVRITPRVSWWITAQHLLSASSMSTIPNPVEDSTKHEKFVKTPIKQRTAQKKINVDGSLITAAFKSLLEPPDKKEEITENITKLNDRINAATTVDEVLSTVENPEFNSQNAYSVVYVLCNWVTAGKIKMDEIQTDKRYLKICSMLGIKTNTAVVNRKQDEDDNYNSAVYGLLQTEKTKKQIERFNVYEIITVLSTLAAKQKRTTPLLRMLTSEIANTKENLNIKQLGDILYSVAVLNFYDEVLMKKVSKDLYTAIPSNERHAVIGSILTSLGVLRYRNERLLNLLSVWIVEHRNIIRPQEISSLMKTLAHMGFTPTNFNEVLEHIITPLKESEMCQSSDWLDIVWALTVLNKATPEHYASVLNSGFLNRLFDSPETESVKAFKLLNVNAAARLMIKDYTGPLLPEDSKLFDTTILRAKEKAALSNSVVSALKILLPSDSIYLNININTKMGFLLDAEFCVDSKCAPLPVNSKSDQDKQVFRIGVLTCAYHEFCRGANVVLGPVNLRKSLLEQQGYKVLLIPYTKVNIKDKLVTRVKYINDNIKLLV